MDFNKLGAAAASAEDMTQDKVFERELPKKGVAFLRLVSYVELGKHKGTNPQYPKPAAKCLLTFELSHPKHLIEIDGKKVPSSIMVRTNKGSTAKSGFKKLFKSLDRALGGGHTHIVQMLGKPLLGEIYHNTVGEGDKKQTFANLDIEGAWSFEEPYQVDKLTEERTAIAVPELQSELKAFLWEPKQTDNDGNTIISDADIVSMWDSLYIEGTREVIKADGSKEEHSKNWLQDTIRKNVEWEGSITQALTEEHVDLDGDEPSLPEEIDAPADAEPEEELNLD
jgi:hypothetical protein